ncbi:phage/plasmid primase, P4 family [Sphingomonas sp. A2-49]|uniref:phage/plasmid primase, P4 family n=1 Tax=Sphingomonas sp. A2-49 TaxID=1391375 RepID=UPI0021CECF9D|nr:phage/plasmid primase, P4 family [Sphingomonas sp. A2-49]MCU6454338.1 phage/plasmid primase, P4 family [Sphingomonas sp. A2-49]
MSSNHPSLSPMGQAAIAFARRGWPVFPCNEKNGRPLVGGDRDGEGKPIPNTGGLHKATCDVDQIASWWRKWPRAQIGLHSGAGGLVHIDFDPRKDEIVDPHTGEIEYDEWTVDRLKAALLAQMGVPLPPTLASLTPSGGEHHWFVMPDGEPIGNSGALPRHIDVRGQGGYIIAPPSVRLGDLDEGGKKGPGAYSWLHGDWTDPSAVLPAPPELVRILRDRTKATSERKPHAPRGELLPVRGDVDDAQRRYALRAMDEELSELERTPEGGGRHGRGRNYGIYQAALKLGGFVLAGALRESVVRAGIEAIVRAMPNNGDMAGALAAIDNGFENASPRDLSAVGAQQTRGRDSGRSSSGRPPGTAASSSHSSPPPPDHTDQKQSSQMGAEDGRGIGKGAGGEDLARECAFLPQTDLGNLQRFLRRYGRNFLYVEQWGWLAWDGRRWNRDMAVSLLGRAVQDTVRAIQDEAAVVRESGIATDPPADADEAAITAHEEAQRGKLDRIVLVKRDGTIVLLSETISKWGRTSEGAGHIASLPKMAEARITARPADFDGDPLLVNMANGTLVFARGENGQPATVRLIEPRRKDLITKIGTAAYDPAAKCPTYDAFLAQVQPMEEMRGFLDVWAGYNMLGDASAQKMAIFYGEGSNGKGVWINTKRAILGDYAWSASINTFMEADRSRKGSDATPDLAALAGRRMVYANEAEEGSKLSDGLVKELTSDEPKGGVRELMKPPFELIITFKNTIIANNKPRIGTDHGIRRRMQLVPWGVIIADKDQDPLLKSKLVKEADGILNRMVTGALQYLSSGLPMPEAIKEATEAYLDENDILGKFLALCIERVPGETLGSSALHELFAAWQTWAQLLPASGKPWSPKYLATQLEKKSFKKRKSSSMVWGDIWPLYSATDFVREGRPVETDLTPPRHKDGTGSPPAPPFPGDDDDILPP